MQRPPRRPSRLQQVVDLATARKVEPGYSITFPTTAEGVFTVAVFANDPRNDATLHVDQYTGKVLADVRWEHYNCVARATETGVMLHEGKMFGWVNQLIVLVICLMILLSAVSGVVIWWKRRPQGGLGVPPLRHDLPKWKTAMVIMLGLAIIFPLVGASLIAVWAVDRLVLARFFGQRAPPGSGTTAWQCQSPPTHQHGARCAPSQKPGAVSVQVRARRSRGAQRRMQRPVQ